MPKSPFTQLGHVGVVRIQDTADLGAPTGLARSAKVACSPGSEVRSSKSCGLHCHKARNKNVLPSNVACAALSALSAHYEGFL